MNGDGKWNATAQGRTCTTQAASAQSEGMDARMDGEKDRKMFVGDLRWIYNRTKQLFRYRNTTKP